MSDYTMTWQDRRDLFQHITVHLDKETNSWMTFETYGGGVCFGQVFTYEHREIQCIQDLSREEVERLHRWTGALLKFWDVTLDPYEEEGPKTEDGSDVEARRKDRGRGR